MSDRRVYTPARIALDLLALLIGVVALWLIFCGHVFLAVIPAAVEAVLLVQKFRSLGFPDKMFRAPPR